jgi:hypothetical protein
MFNSDLVDIVISLVSVYLILSLFCSTLVEILESRLRYRAIALENGLRDLLDAERRAAGDPLAGTSDLIVQLYQHELITSLYRGTYTPAPPSSGWFRDGLHSWLRLLPFIGGLERSWARVKAMPSYISRDSFTYALLDIMDDPPFDLAQAATAPAPAKVPKRPAIAALLASSAGVVSAANLRNRIATSPCYNGHVKTILTLHLDASGGDMALFLAKVGAWFDEGMDRVSGWYKRRTQFLLLLVGTAVAIGLNADSIAIARQIATTKPLRDALVQGALTRVRQPAPKPIDAPDAAAPPAKDGSPAPAPTIGDATADYQDLARTSLDLGWSSANRPRDGLAWLCSACGWAFTAIAISLGAPFWFDLLSKVVQVRSSIKPEASPKKP